MPGYLMNAYNDNSDNADQPLSVGYVAMKTIADLDSHDINLVKLKMYKIGTPGTMVLSFRGVQGGAPFGADVFTVNFDANTLPDVPAAWISIKIPDYTVGGIGGDRFIVVHGTGLSVGVNDIYWRVNNASSGVFTSATGADLSWSNANVGAQYELWLNLFGKPLGLSKG